ncbi:unnamed protein product, partial [Amoebophrya sp. A25]|eukprot:GSA25T00025910001.1
MLASQQRRAAKRAALQDAAALKKRELSESRKNAQKDPLGKNAQKLSALVKSIPNNVHLQHKLQQPAGVLSLAVSAHRPLFQTGTDNACLSFSDFVDAYCGGSDSRELNKTSSKKLSPLSLQKQQTTTTLDAFFVQAFSKRCGIRPKRKGGLEKRLNEILDDFTERAAPLSKVPHIQDADKIPQRHLPKSDKLKTIGIMIHRKAGRKVLPSGTSGFSKKGDGIKDEDDSPDGWISSRNKSSSKEQEQQPLAIREKSTEKENDTPVGGDARLRFRSGSSNSLDEQTPREGTNGKDGKDVTLSFVVSATDAPSKDVDKRDPTASHNQNEASSSTGHFPEEPESKQEENFVVPLPPMDWGSAEKADFLERSLELLWRLAPPEMRFRLPQLLKTVFCPWWSADAVDLMSSPLVCFGLTYMGHDRVYALQRCLIAFSETEGDRGAEVDVATNEKELAALARLRSAYKALNLPDPVFEEKKSTYHVKVKQYLLSRISRLALIDVAKLACDVNSTTSTLPAFGTLPEPEEALQKVLKLERKLLDLFNLGELRLLLTNEELERIEDYRQKLLGMRDSLRTAVTDVGRMLDNTMNTIRQDAVRELRAEKILTQAGRQDETETRSTYLSPLWAYEVTQREQQRDIDSNRGRKRERGERGIDSNRGEELQDGDDDRSRRGRSGRRQGTERDGRRNKVNEQGERPKDHSGNKDHRPRDTGEDKSS